MSSTFRIAYCNVLRRLIRRHKMNRRTIHRKMKTGRHKTAKRTDYRHTTSLLEQGQVFWIRICQPKDHTEMLSTRIRLVRDQQDRSS